MPSFWKTNRASKNSNFFTEQQHPDLPLPRTRPAPIQRSTSVSERQNTASAAENRRSVVIPPSAAEGFSNFASPVFPSSPNEPEASAPPPQLSVSRSHTVLRRDGSFRGQENNGSPSFDTPPQGSPSAPWSPDFVQLPAPSEQQEVRRAEQASMNQGNAGKTSSDSGQNVALDRWSQRRLQRLTTEQGFREQRQGGNQVLSPPASDSSSYNSSGTAYPLPDAQPQPPLHQQPQPHPSAQHGAYQASRANSVAQHGGPALQPQPVSSASRSPAYPAHEQPQVVHMQSQHQYSPPGTLPQYQGQQTQEANRPQLQGQRSYSHQPDESPIMPSNNSALPAPKAVRSGAGNRQSVHNGLTSREGPAGGQQGVPSFNASVVPPASQGQPYRTDQCQSQPQSADVRRTTPQPAQMGEDMSEEDVNQLIKDHKELREKYTKVKKYYFEKEDQVKQLQNSLAHQRLSQSRTSLDDSEYTTRFNRLDGLVAQLAFSIRKSWRSIPPLLSSSVNKDAVATGKQEMTAAGRSFISSWLVEEVFEKCFHPDLDPALSTALRNVQKNIRRFAPPAQTSEEEDYLTAKVVNWRLSTLEGLQDVLRSPQCPTHRAHLTDTLKEGLCSALAVHLQDPPPSDLEGGVHMIIELVVSIAIHLPLESRDVVIEYFLPGFSIMPEQMKIESGIPPLITSIADDAAERASMKSAASDITDMTEGSTAGHDGPPSQSKKRSMLSALTGSERKNKNAAAQGKHAGASGSSSSLHRPESSQGVKDDQPPRVRMAAGIGVSIRGRSVLVKAPVFST